MDLDAAQIVASLQDRWAEAFRQRHWPQLAALYTQDAAFYGSTPKLYRGQNGVLSYFEALPLRFERARFGVPALVLPARGVIAASGPVMFDVDEDGATRSLPYRMTQVLVEQAGSWLIATHHASIDPSWPR